MNDTDGKGDGSGRAFIAREGDAQRLRVALVNDYELIVRGLRSVLADSLHLLDIVDLQIGGDYRHVVDVALFDTFGSARLGLDRVAELAADPAITAVAVYTWDTSDDRLDALLQRGARAVMAKSISPLELTAGLLAVSRGEIVVSREFRRQQSAAWPGSALGLTRRESEIIACLVTGKSNRDIADSLTVSENTVKTHLKSIFQKLNVRSRTQAMALIHGDPSFRRRISAAPTEQHE